MTGTELKNLRKLYNLSGYELADAVGIAQSSIARWEINKDKEVPKAKEAQMLADFFTALSGKVNANAKIIGEIDDLEDNDGNTKFTEISPGRYRMKVDLVPNYARAGYLAGFEDHTYVEELPKHELTVTKYHKGKYLAFDVVGDSMFDGSIDSVPDGCIVTGREIYKDHWKNRLHTHAYPNWVFVHKTEGILVKLIKSQNLETGDIVLESLNPDKNDYPDININLNDVYKIYNVVKRELD